MRASELRVLLLLLFRSDNFNILWSRVTAVKQSRACISNRDGARLLQRFVRFRLPSNKHAVLLVEGYFEQSQPRLTTTLLYGLCNCGTLHWDQRCIVRGCLPGGLHPSEEGRSRVRRIRDVVHRSGRVHRLRRVRAGVSRFGDLRARRSSREMGRLRTEKRRPLRALAPVCDSISARHARLSYHHNQWWLEDLGSRNGILLNQVRLQMPTVVTSEDEFLCGETHFLVAVTGERPAPTM